MKYHHLSTKFINLVLHNCYFCMCFIWPYVYPDEPSQNLSFYGYMSETPRPSVEVQEDMILNMIADSLVDASLDAIAVVQSPVDMFKRVLSVSDTENVRDYMQAFNFDSVLVVETLYTKEQLPSMIHLIQENMYAMERPRFSDQTKNYRDRLFHYDDSLWLAFLKRDHVLNLEPTYSGVHQVKVKDRIENALEVSQEPKDVLIRLGLSTLLTEKSMFSQVEEFSSFLIQAPEGLRFPGVKNRTRRFLPFLHVPDPDKEYVLPPDFPDDVMTLLHALSAVGPGDALKDIELRTAPGEKVRDRLQNILASRDKAHVKAEWVRRTRGELFREDLPDPVYQVEGVLHTEVGKPIPNALIMVQHVHTLNTLFGDSDKDGLFSIQSDYPLPNRVRMLVSVKGYAPTARFIEVAHDKEIDFRVQSGTHIKFHLEWNEEEWTESAPDEGVVFLVDEKHRMAIAVLAFNDFDDEDRFYTQLVQDGNTSVELVPGRYRLIWGQIDGPTLIDLGIRELGKNESEILTIGSPTGEQLIEPSQFDKWLQVPDTAD